MLRLEREAYLVHLLSTDTTFLLIYLALSGPGTLVSSRRGGNSSRYFLSGWTGQFLHNCLRAYYLAHYAAVPSQGPVLPGSFPGSREWDFYHQEPPTSRFSLLPPGGGGDKRESLLISGNTHSLQTHVSQFYLSPDAPLFL